MAIEPAGVVVGVADAAPGIFSADWSAVARADATREIVHASWRAPDPLDPPAVVPLRPRAFTAADMLPGAAPTIMLGRTLRGFEIKLVGAAPRAARFAGFSDKWLTVVTFAISGALAGLAGIIEVTATINHLQPNISPGYGFTASIVVQSRYAKGH